MEDNISDRVSLKCFIRSDAGNTFYPSRLNLDSSYVFNILVLCSDHAGPVVCLLPTTVGKPGTAGSAKTGAGKLS
jgi:hypothetical protein